MKSRSTRDSIGIPGRLAVGGIVLLLILLYVAKSLSFDADTEAKLMTLQIAFRLKVRMFLARVQAQLGLDPIITSARRTAAQQAAQHAADPRNPAPNAANPDVHMRGIAVDLNFKKNGVIVLRKASTAAAWAPVVAIAKQFNLTWGGTFKGYPDNVHFDGR